MGVAQDWVSDALLVEIGGENYTLNSGIAGGVILTFPPSAVERITSASDGWGVAWLMSAKDALRFASALNGKVKGGPN